MSTISEIYNSLRNLDQNEAFNQLQTIQIRKDSDFSEVSRLLDCLHTGRRFDAIKFLSSTINENPTLSCANLISILNKMKDDDGYRTLTVVEKRISPLLNLRELPRVLDLIADRDRYKVVKMICDKLSSVDNDDEKLRSEDIASLLQKVPNFSLATVVAIKPWISKKLDFTRMKQVLESCPDKNCRIEVLGELTSLSTESQRVLKCSDIRNILSSIPQQTAERGLKIILQFVSPEIDINRVDLLFETIMKTDQVKVLTALLSISNYRINSMNEIRSIIEKMDQPYRGLELIKDNIDKSIDINKISTVLNIIPSIKRLETIQLFVDLVSLEVNSCKLSTFDMRSVLMLMEANTMTEALRLLKPRLEITSERDYGRVLECFSDATRPVAEVIIQIKT